MTTNNQNNQVHDPESVEEENFYNFAEDGTFQEEDPALSPEQSEEPEEPEEPKKPEKPEGSDSPSNAPVALTQEQIQEIIKGVRPEPTKEQKTELSEDEIKQMLQPVEVSPEHLRALGFEDPTEEQVQGLQTLFNQASQNATSIAKVMVEHIRNELQGRIEPIQGYVQQVKAKETEQKFYDTYPGLKPYDQLVKATAAQMVNDPKYANLSEDKIFEAVAKSTTELLSKSGVQIEAEKTMAHHSAESNSTSEVPSPAKTMGSGRSMGKGTVPSKDGFDPDADIYS